MDKWSGFYSGTQIKAFKMNDVFRNKAYLFDEFLSDWATKLKSQTQMTPIVLKLQKMLDSFVELTPALKVRRMLPIYKILTQSFSIVVETLLALNIGLNFLGLLAFPGERLLKH